MAVCIVESPAQFVCWADMIAQADAIGECKSMSEVEDLQNKCVGRGQSINQLAKGLMTSARDLAGHNKKKQRGDAKAITDQADKDNEKAAEQKRAEEIQAKAMLAKVKSIGHFTVDWMAANHEPIKAYDNATDVSRSDEALNTPYVIKACGQLETALTPGNKYSASLARWHKSYEDRLKQPTAGTKTLSTSAPFMAPHGSEDLKPVWELAVPPTAELAHTLPSLIAAVSKPFFFGMLDLENFCGLELDYLGAIRLFMGGPIRYLLVPIDQVFNALPDDKKHIDTPESKAEARFHLVLLSFILL